MIALNEIIVTNEPVQEIPVENDSLYRDAYIIAVEHGFEGTEEEWLESLIGPQGPVGPTGPRGDKGEAGAINFVVVSELPATGSGDSIYLVPNPTGENNNFDEFIFQDGAWEKIGSAGVEVNLEEYVKKTDYANANIGGVVKIGSTYNGISIDKDGFIGCYSAEKANIDGRNSRKPICPTIMDYAIKVGLTTNKETWTEEEKAAVRTLLGVNIEDALDAIIAIQEELIGGNA